MGELSEDTRSEVFKTIDILAIPSIWLETGPYVLLEAFAESTPVLGSNLGGIAELVTDGIDGKLVKPNDVSEWTESIKDLSEHKELISKYRAGIGVVRSSLDVASDMSKVYDKALKLLDNTGVLATN